MASTAAAEGRSVDPLVWKACAGMSIKIPPVQSLAYYFPQGHAEAAANGVPDLGSSLHAVKPFVLCRVAGVKLLAAPETDEVFVRMVLDPRISHPAVAPVPVAEGGNGVLSFAKVLTPSDANNGGGFSVPRFCADAIFPPLDYSAKPPVQMLVVRDVHGVKWSFRHIYRGTPRRHLLTTGWSKFVNSKKLVSGDSVVFIKKSSGELFVGVRRTGRSAGTEAFFQFSHQFPPPSTHRLGENLCIGEGFSRKFPGKVSPEAVVEAARLASMDQTFEIAYYPRVGFPDFVVCKELVEGAVRLRWATGMRVKMTMEMEDSCRMTPFQGTVTCILQHPAPFIYSPWRTLEVSWDEPDSNMQNVKMVSPWQVEMASVSMQIPTHYPVLKKSRITSSQESLTNDMGENMFLSVPEIADKIVGNANISMFNRNTFPVGIQGARHDPVYVSSISRTQPHLTDHMFFEKINVNVITDKAGPTSSDLNIKAALQSGYAQQPSQNYIHRCGSELFGKIAESTPAKLIGSSFQLFGKTIKMEQPVIADVSEGYKDENITGKPFNFTLSCPQKQRHDGHDGQLKGVSPVKT